MIPEYPTSRDDSVLNEGVLEVRTLQAGVTMLSMRVPEYPTSKADSGINESNFIPFKQG